VDDGAVKTSGGELVERRGRVEDRTEIDAVHVDVGRIERGDVGGVAAVGVANAPLTDLRTIRVDSSSANAPSHVGTKISDQ